MAETGTEMRRTWLVQRLLPPQERANPFAFGGGLRNGGLSDEAMGLLRGVCSFDYMGSAEFEFGEVPRALARVASCASRGELSMREIELSLEDVATVSFWRDEKRERYLADDAEGVVSVWIIAPDAWQAEAESRVRGWARERWSDLKEDTRLSRSIRCASDEERKWLACGWLEMSNGFMFFTDEDMATGFAQLFGLGTEDD